jgi:hypothetical protein
LCRNPEYKDVFKLAFHGSGYPLPGGYDDTCVFVWITMSIMPPSASVQDNLSEHLMARYLADGNDQLDLQALSAPDSNAALPEPLKTSGIQWLIEGEFISSAVNQQAKPLTKVEPLHDYR